MNSGLEQDNGFICRLERGDFPASRKQFSATQALPERDILKSLIEDQMTSRLLDIHARRLRVEGHCFYTIGSAGHEGNAVVAAALRPTDPAYLHYRSGAFYLQRARQVPDQAPIRDLLLSFTARAEDPISGGRHKVLGSRALNIPPQTSTVASHLPKAVGAALAIGTANSIGVSSDSPADALIVCSFGDASANHSVAQGAINMASWCAYQKLPVPIIFLCEDNQLGISVHTPKGWIENSFSTRPSLAYLQCDGLDLVDSWGATQKAVLIAREQRRPVFLHMKTLRLMGHAGADTETAYRSPQSIADDWQQDPLLHSARICIEQGVFNQNELIQTYRNLDRLIQQTAAQVIRLPTLRDAEQIMQPLLPSSTSVPRSSYPMRVFNPQARKELFVNELKALESPQPMGRLINMALAEIMAEQDNVVLFGEDVGKKGGVYGVTLRLQEKFGPARVFNTLLDETSILGTAIGFAQQTLLPIPEIQFLAYVHNAEDQIRGEAATLSFFSNGQYRNPMVIRIAGLAYQKGFGGHFHNDNSLAVFRDIPGIIIACPSNGQDAVAMLRESVRLAQNEGRVVIFLEPIALYRTKDLHQEGDQQWCSVYPQQHESILLGELSEFKHGSAEDLCIVSYGNGYYLSRQAAEILSKEHGIHCKVVDLRWLAPLNEPAILRSVAGYDCLIVVDECRRTGSISEAISTLLVEHHQLPRKLERITAEDCFIPLGDAARHVLPSREKIISVACDLVKQTS